MVQATRRSLDETCHRAVDPIAEAEPPGVEVVEALANECRVLRQHRGRLADHLIAFSEANNALAKFRDKAGELVTENDGIIYVPALLAAVLMQIAAANADGVHLQQYVVFSNCGNRKLAQLNRARILCVVNQSNHRGRRQSPSFPAQSSLTRARCSLTANVNLEQRGMNS